MNAIAVMLACALLHGTGGGDRADRPNTAPGDRPAPNDLFEPAEGAPGQPLILLAPADGDDPVYRQAIADLTNGLVEYFDARSGTPDLQYLLKFDAIHVWSAGAPGFADRELFGNLLGDAADAGKCIVLGYGCLLANGGLGGTITTPSWCPVTSPSGVSLGGDAYDWDGSTCIWTHVHAAFTVNYREDVALQGAGMYDGHYDDGQIAAAFNDPGSGIPSTPPVIYLNGARGNGAGDVDIPCWVVSAFACHGMEVVIPPDDCPHDLNLDDRVDTGDMLVVIGAWGTAQADINGDGTTDVSDLLELFGGWGDCPDP